MVTTFLLLSRSFGFYFDIRVESITELETSFVINYKALHVSKLNLIILKNKLTCTLLQLAQMNSQTY